MPTTRVAGAELRYRVDGPPGAPVVVLANSLGATLAMWEDQMAALTRHYRVLRYDMRGHGGSTSDGEPFDVERLGDDALALLDALELTRVHFCGLSLGGLVGMWLGGRAPNRLHKLVLSNTAASLGPAAGWDSRIAAVERGGMTAVASKVLGRWFSETFREREPATVSRARRMLLSINPKDYVLACAAARDADQRSNVRAVRASTLVISGTHDQATPRSEGLWLAEHLADARYVELPAGHLSNIEASAGFNEVLLSFLAESRDPNG